MHVVVRAQIENMKLNWVNVDARRLLACLVIGN